MNIFCHPAHDDEQQQEAAAVTSTVIATHGAAAAATAISMLINTYHVRHKYTMYQVHSF